MDFKGRLAAAIKRANASRAQLAKALGVSSQAISQVLAGDTKALTAENTAKAARFLQVDWYWLATGEGSPEPQQSWPLERVQVGRYLALPPEDRAYVEAKLEAAIEACEVATDQAREDRRHFEAGVIKKKPAATRKKAA